MYKRRCAGLGPDASRKRSGLLSWWFTKRPAPKKPAMATTIPMKIEPKTFFANERTFLSWLHMAVTIGSIGAALLGFSGAATHDPKAHAVSTDCIIFSSLLRCWMHQRAGTAAFRT